MEATLYLKPNCIIEYRFKSGNEHVSNYNRLSIIKSVLRTVISSVTRMANSSTSVALEKISSYIFFFTFVITMFFLGIITDIGLTLCQDDPSSLEKFIELQRNLLNNRTAGFNLDSMMAFSIISPQELSTMVASLQPTGPELDKIIALFNMTHYHCVHVSDNTILCYNQVFNTIGHSGNLDFYSNLSDQKGNLMHFTNTTLNYLEVPDHYIHWLKENGNNILNQQFVEIDRRGLVDHSTLGREAPLLK